ILVIYETTTKKLVGYSEIERISLKNRRLLKNKNITMIESFCISNSYTKQGLGKMLFNHIIEDAKKNESDLIQLVVWDFNKDAIKFYKALGMTNRNIRMELHL
ncbi:MAG: GNAT family N-acetyltransferase, partial [Sarcina sp.]